MKRLLLLFALTACTPGDDTAARVLKNAGYTDVKLKGYPFFACSDDDTFNVAFWATGPSGERVRGALCCGMFKNCTVRLD